MNRTVKLLLNYTALMILFGVLRNGFPDVWSEFDSTHLLLMAFAFTWAGDKR